MSGNLVEFIKVFTLVFTFSGLILAGRRYMLKFDEEPEDESNVVNFPNRNEKTDRMDYDGMGNYGRFPKKLKRKK
ncbi:MAG: hypothetical protein CMF52_06890 [Legionellales bacterium]|nr:hypothetical protein [Legionellales bacterium]|tara:strand:+ start:959 stop:1183 length:225 start_codon:yes stop_codon:yes gene_type:complete